MQLTFCTTCRNRVWQLKHTLGTNLSAAGNHQISLVDYGSEDEIDAWIWENFTTEIRSGKLIYFSVENDVSWNCSRAKNLAHRIAQGDYLFNLDADNFVTETDVAEIEILARDHVACHQFSSVHGDGSFGRIGLPRDVFYELGGYDESMLPMSVHDADLLKRLQVHTGRVVAMSKPSIPAIPNQTQVSPDAGRLAKPKPYLSMQRVNTRIMNTRLRLEGPIRRGGFSTFRGRLNGEAVTLDGLGTVWRQEE